MQSEQANGNDEIVLVVAIIPGISLAVLETTLDPLPPDGCKRIGGLDNNTNTVARFQPDICILFTGQGVMHSHKDRTSRIAAEHFQNSMQICISVFTWSVQTAKKVC